MPPRGCGVAAPHLVEGERQVAAVAVAVVALEQPVRVHRPDQRVGRPAAHGLPDIARNVIQRSSNPRFLTLTSMRRRGDRRAILLKTSLCRVAK